MNPGSDGQAQPQLPDTCDDEYCKTSAVPKGISRDEWSGDVQTQVEQSMQVQIGCHSLGSLPVLGSSACKCGRKKGVMMDKFNTNSHISG
jgi:hypothetical protein